MPLPPPVPVKHPLASRKRSKGWKGFFVPTRGVTLWPISWGGGESAKLELSLPRSAAAVKGGGGDVSAYAWCASGIPLAGEPLPQETPRAQLPPREGKRGGT